MIRLEGLRLQAGDFGLRIDDLTISTGEYLAVLGPTAAGKTVLLETVAGLRRPHGGRIRLGDIDVTHEPPERRNTGLVYQDYALFPHLTVAQNIAFGCRGARMRPRTLAGEAIQSGETRQVDPGGRSDGMAQVRELAALLGIDGLLQRYPEGLSGGEQQRVALARALAIRPAVLLLDEPLSALDGPTRLELRAELKRLHEKLGATVMHVTHDLDEALVLGERIAVLVDGECRQVGEPQDVSRFPADAEVARLVGAANVFPVADITGEDGSEQAGVKRVRLENGLEIRAGSGEPAASKGRIYAVVRADEVTLEPMDSDRTGEAVNYLVGGVSAIQVRSSHVCVEVTVSPQGDRAFDAPQSSEGPVVLKVYVLRPELEAKGLGPGSRVRLLVPFGAVHVCPGADDKDSGRL